MTNFMALGGAAILGLSAYNNIQQGEAAFKTKAGRAFMHINHFLLTCCLSELTVKDTSTSTLGLALSVGGLVLYGAKMCQNIYDDEKRFKTTKARALETLGDIGGAIALIQVGHYFDSPPLTTAYYTAQGLWSGMEYLAYHSFHLVSQVTRGLLFGPS